MIRSACFYATIRLGALLMLGSHFSPEIACGANQTDWDRSVYHIRVHLAVDTTSRVPSEFATQIAKYLEQRIFATLYPLWTVDISLEEGPFRYRLLTHLDELSEAENPDEISLGFDKHMYLTLSATSEGYLLQCRERDHATQTLGPVLTRRVKQERMVAERCFQLLCDTFAPLAKIRRLDDDSQHVALHFKGSVLPRIIDQTLFIRPSDVYQPLMIRMTRTGEVRPGGITPVPWTFLEIKDAQNGSARCRIHSGTKHPFGVRRRGRVEHLAIALRQRPAATRVRFYARHDKTQGLMGYEVFRRDDEKGKSQLIGLTNNRGSVNVIPGKTKITTLFLRSGNELLAKVPVLAGRKGTLEIPIADDIARLNAQATLTSLREQLIDLVARRNILIARIRDRIEEASFDEARDLLRQIDELPGRAQFAQRISSAENNRRNQSDDPRIQARIEKMFANTRKLLGQFLNSRQISDLQGELKAAQSSGA